MYYVPTYRLLCVCKRILLSCIRNRDIAKKALTFFPMSVLIQGLGHLDHMTTKTKIKSGKFKCFDNTTL